MPDCGATVAQTLRAMTYVPVELTPRERDVVRCVVAGRTNREAAIELGLTEQAVKNVLSTIFQKCHLRNRTQLALFAVRNKLVDS
jgi:DNA-binding NarL/FixJ family response regulator